MEPTRRDYDADTLTVLYAWRQGWATDNDLRAATDMHQQAIARLTSAPTTHRSPEDIRLERGAVVVSLAENEP